MVGIEINQYRIDRVQKKVKEAFAVQSKKLQRGEKIASDFQDCLREVTDTVSRLDSRTRGLCEEAVPQSSFEAMVRQFELRFERLEEHMKTSLPALQASMVCKACQWSGVEIQTACTSLLSSSLRKSA